MLQVSPRQSPYNPPRLLLTSGCGQTMAYAHALVPFVTESKRSRMATFAHVEAKHTIRSIDDQRLIMSDHTERHPHMLRQFLERLTNVARGRLIHSGSRLISKHQRWAMNERPSNRYTLPLTTR